MKMITGVDWCLCVVQLPKPGLFQATVALEYMPLQTDNRSSGNGGQFVISIGFVKSSMRDIQTAKSIEATEKPTFIGDANDDKVRVRTIGRKKRLADVKNGVAGLNNLLWNRQIGPDKDVNVLSGCALGEFHGKLL